PSVDPYQHPLSSVQCPRMPAPENDPSLRGAPMKRTIVCSSAIDHTLAADSIITGALRALAILAVCGLAATQATAQIAVRNQGYIPFSDPPINYRSDDLHDPVAKLEQKVEKGEAKLDYSPERGYLPSVLKLLQVPVNSQTLVFS